MADKRFEITESQGTARGVSVITDRETGVQYLFVKFGTAGGLCPLLDQQGKPIVRQNQQGQ